MANRGYATPAGPRLHTLADVIACAAAEGLTGRLDGTIRAITSLASDRAANR